MKIKIKEGVTGSLNYSDLTDDTYIYDENKRIKIKIILNFYSNWSLPSQHSYFKDKVTFILHRLKFR